MMSNATNGDAENLPEELSHAEVRSVEGSGEAGKEQRQEEKKLQEEIPEILNSDDFISKPFLSKKCTVPEAILVFHHSFGYDCQRYFNLVLLEEKILAFASGNLIHIFNVGTNELWFRRSAGGGGIGHMAKNPNPAYQHLAVAEKGNHPLIIIYNWPSLDIVCLLKQGAEKMYCHINYSPDGEMLCSQGGAPDYLLIVWNWKASKKILCCQSCSNDVYKAAFSTSVPDHIITCGMGHINFWKVRRTFTGLKLTGSLGRFGRTEISDIIGFLTLPDGKVISGCEWGNMLLWEGGLIKVEVSRKKKKYCHAAPITQFEFENGDLTTVGLDGFVKMWYFETIDAVDPPEENRFFELEPMMEIEIKNDDNEAALMCVVKISEDPEDTFWYGQDANGGIWKFDLNIKSSLRQSPEQLLICHAGPVIDMAASPVDEHLATLGKDGRLFIYNYLEKKLLLVKRFPAQGSCLLWLPLHVYKTESVLVAAFGDGVVRVVVVSLEEMKTEPSSKEEFITLIQATKPHSKPITAMSTNDEGNLLVTGSEDCTVFVYQITQSSRYISLVPIGFVTMPNVVTFLSWKPHAMSTLLVSCCAGTFVEVILPEYPQEYTYVSFHLVKTKTKSITFQSCKSQIRRDMNLKEREEWKLKKLGRKREKMDKNKKENLGTDIDEETFLADSECEEELEPLYVPEVPNTVLFALYTPKDTIWLSVAGYDAGYMYEFDMDKKEPVCCTMIADADNIEIYSYLFNHNKKYLILGMQNGQIRVNRVNPDNHTDLSDYWLYSMHDNTNGRIRRMCFNYDHHFMFSCGDDGNIFSYHVNFEDENDYIIPSKEHIASPGIPIQEKVLDIEDIKYLSLEETKAKAEHDKRIAAANQRKQKVLQRLGELKIKFGDFISRNMRLPESQQIPRCDLEIHPDITKDLDGTLEQEIDLVKQKLAFDVEKSRLGLQKLQDYFINVLDSMTVYVCSIRTNKRVSTFRQRKLGQEFDDAKAAVQFKIEEAEKRGRSHQIHIVQEEAPEEAERKIPQMEAFLRAIPTNTPEYIANKKLQRLVKKYMQRKQREEQRGVEWDVLLKQKPDETKSHPDDIAAITEAEEAIGDYKLKSAPNYRVPKHLRMTTVKKYDQLLESREKLFLIKDNFNSKVYDLRNKKTVLIERFSELNATLKCIHRELEPVQRKFLSDIPKFDEELEFPERGTKLTEEDKEALMGQKLQSSASDNPMTDGAAGDTEPVDEEFEAVLGSRYPQAEVGTLEQNICKPYFARGCNVSTEQLGALATEDNTVTAWETEQCKCRMKRKLYEQDQILTEAGLKVEAFDKEVEDLSNLKIRVAVEAKFLELHLLTLQQELIILRDFEDVEDKVSNRVLNSLKEKHELERMINDLQKQAQIKQTEIKALLNKEVELQDKFQMATNDSKFSDFLRKVYKKYKPSRVRNADDGLELSNCLSSSLSSSNESLDNTANTGSEELGPVTLDENTCPEGCEQDLYNMTFELRSECHGCEQELIEMRKQVEALKKQLELNLNKLKSVEETLKINEEELEIFETEKQQKLNEVECLVVLKLSQMQHFRKGTNTMENLSNSLLFSQKTLQQLYSRAGELKRETKIQMEKHTKNQKHFCRLKADCQHMTEMIHKLKADIKEDMQRKFGREINLDELEESVLRRLVAEMKYSTKDIKKAYERRILEMQEKVREKQEHLSRHIQENTEKLHLLTTLEEEKHNLDKLLRIQASKLEEASDQKEDPYASEIEKLIQIKNHQALEIESLKNEIRMLSVKIKPLPPILGILGTEAESGQPFPTMPEEMSAEEEEGSEEMDLTGIRRILNKITQSIPAEAGHTLLVQPEGSGVHQILTEITDNLNSREPSIHDITTVQEIFNEIKQKYQSVTDIIHAVRNMVHNIVAGQTARKSPEEMSYILCIVQDIIDEVHDSSGNEESTHTVKHILPNIIEKITGRQPTEGDPNDTEGILQCVAQQLHSSEVLLNPIFAVQQIICDVISVLQTTEISTNEKQDKVKQLLDDVTGKSAAEEDSTNCTESVRNIIRELVEDITCNRLALAKSDNVVTEMESLREFKDTAQGKEILQETCAEVISHIREISDSEETEQDTKDADDPVSEG